MSTRFFTNMGEHTLFRKFQGVFENNPDIEQLGSLDLVRTIEGKA